MDESASTTYPLIQISTPRNGAAGTGLNSNNATTTSGDGSSSIGTTATATSYCPIDLYANGVAMSLLGNSSSDVATTILRGSKVGIVQTGSKISIVYPDKDGK